MRAETRRSKGNLLPEDVVIETFLARLEMIQVKEPVPELDASGLAENYLQVSEYYHQVTYQDLQPEQLKQSSGHKSEYPRCGEPECCSSRLVTDKVR